MKDLCVRCDARPALPGKLYCALCLGLDFQYFRWVRELWEQASDDLEYLRPTGSRETQPRLVPDLKARKTFRASPT